MFVSRAIPFSRVFPTTRRRSAAVSADIVRLLGLVSVLGAAIGWGLGDALSIAAAAIAAWIPRVLRAPTVLDAAFGLSLLVAAWSLLLDLYSEWDNWDLFVHATSNGLIAAVGMVLLTRAGLASARPAVRLPRTALALSTLTLGVASGFIWELFEWASNRFFDATLFVSYTDTLGDMAVGAFGSAIAGIALPRMFMPAPEPVPEPTGWLPVPTPTASRSDAPELSFSIGGGAPVLVTEMSNRATGREQGLRSNSQRREG